MKRKDNFLFLIVNDFDFDYNSYSRCGYMKAIDIKNLKFSYDKDVFNNLNLNIDKGSFATILGKGASGKTTLFKILSLNLVYEGEVLVLNKSIRYCLEKGWLGLISASYMFREKTAREEILRSLENKGLSRSKIDDQINRISKKIGIKNILDCYLKNLNIKEKILILFVLQLINKPKVLILDNVFSYIDNEKDIIFKELLRANKRGGTIINITNDAEECLFGSDVVILNDEVLKIRTCDLSEDVFINNGLEAPFIVSLSSKLKFYGLVDKNYVSMAKLVNDLWE